MNDFEIMELEAYWPYQVVVLADIITRHTTSVAKKHGSLNLSQWRVLAAIADKDGRSAAEVVAVTPMDKGIVSRATASLVQNGLIKKVNDKDDKRRAHLHMTNPGKKIYTAIRQELTSQTGTIAVSEKLNARLLEVIESMKRLHTR